MATRPTAGQRLVAALRARLSCACCGETRDVLIDFHHIDPASKDGKVLRLAKDGAALDRVRDEVAKCAPLCPICHRLIHLGQLESRHLRPIDVTGTLSRPAKRDRRMLPGW